MLFVGGDNSTSIAKQYGAAYARGDYQAMYNLLSTDSQQRISLNRFASMQQQVRQTAAATAIAVGPPKAGKNHSQQLPVVVRSSVFGRLAGTLTVPLETTGGHQGVRWTSALVFPGVRAGETLHRTTELPPRAALLARDGSTLARGTPRTLTTDPALASIVGQVGPIPPTGAEAYSAAGLPATASVGLTGLERVFETKLRGKPGGALLAGDRQLASVAPVAASDVRTTIVPSIQRAAVTALGSLGTPCLIHQFSYSMFRRAPEEGLIARLRTALGPVVSAWLDEPHVGKNAALVQQTLESIAPSEAAEPQRVLA